mmetsp:Transcript_125511/g.313561  ORF Transcript_125511/g.313561 Transcript_125511/m.313561 type:complete len:638 (-) Transcript_125511:285-2198(-)
MAGLPDPISQPLALIDALFDASNAAQGPPGAEWGEREHFIRTLGLEDEQNYAKIPCLNDQNLVENLPPFSLVRYRALVQDVFEPEIYISCLEEHDEGMPAEPKPPRLVTTKYRESVEPAPGREFRETSDNALSQRGACYCVPMPGESAWAREAAARWGTTAKTPQPAKSAATSLTPAPSKKRAQPDEDVEMDDGIPGGVQCARAFRRGRTNASQSASTTVSGAPNADEFGLNLPLPWEERRGIGASTACIVKLYDNDAEALRLSDTVEIVGILCINPEMANLEPSQGEGLWNDARQPSTALVPRLHAITVRKLPFFHPLVPFTPDWLTEARLAAAYQANLAAPGALAAARTAAVAQLKRQLGGDTLAAEYLLMLLVSRSFSKIGDKALGTWSLNLSRWPQGLEVKNLSQAASELVPRAVHLSLNGPALNQQRWKPTKDFHANRLVSGQLQLAPGSLLVLDETELAEGQVSAQGVKALGAISTLVTDRILACDFAAFDAKVPLELSCLLVSKGKSIVKGVEAVLPMQPQATPPAAAAHATPPEPAAMDAARLLLGLVTRQPKAMNIPDAVAERVSADFSSIRTALEVPSDLCHTWMALARALCLTYGENELTAERWQLVADMERERLRRCQEMGMLLQ